MRTSLPGSVVTSVSRSTGAAANPNRARSADTSQFAVQNERCPSVVDRISKTRSAGASTSTASVMERVMTSSRWLRGVALFQFYLK